MHKKPNRMHVPARASIELIQNVNIRRDKDQKTWPQLIEILFNAYLKKGLKAFGE